MFPLVTPTCACCCLFCADMNIDMIHDESDERRDGAEKYLTWKYDLLGHLYVLARQWCWYKGGTKSKEPGEETHWPWLWICVAENKRKCTSIITSILRKILPSPVAECNLRTGLVCLVRRVGEEESRILKSWSSCQFMSQIHRGVPGSIAISEVLMMLITILTKCLVQSDSEATPS